MPAKKASKKQEKTKKLPKDPIDYYDRYKTIWNDQNSELTSYVLNYSDYIQGPPRHHLVLPDGVRAYFTVTSCKNRMIKTEGHDAYWWGTQAEALAAIKTNIRDFLDMFDSFDRHQKILLRMPLTLRHNDAFTKFSYVIRILVVDAEVAYNIERGVMYDGQENRS
jgi:hypothetical protein